MTAPELLGVILGSAAVGALISSVATGIFNARMKRAELERQDMEMALKMADLKYQQMVRIAEWEKNAKGVIRSVEFWDPMVSVIEYRKAMKEYRETGAWKKGQAGHGQGGS
jgi:hypothetical protein